MITKGDYIENLKNKIQMEQLTHITLLSPETAKHLQVPMIMMMIMMPMSMITIMLTTIIMMLMMIIKNIVIKSSFCLHRTWLSPRSQT